MTMKRIFLTASSAAMLLSLFFSFSFSYKVDVAELKDSKKIEFINYEGKRYQAASPG